MIRDAPPQYNRSLVLFWEIVVETELSRTLSYLEKKKRHIDYLRNLPFEKQTERNFRQIKFLEEDIASSLGLVTAIEELKCAYVDFTASVAEKHILILAQRDLYLKKLLHQLETGL